MLIRNKLLPDHAMIFVHDTGNLFEDATGEMKSHQPAEQEFVDWIKTDYPEYDVIHIHGFPHLGYRQGQTWIKKYKRLVQSS